MSSINTNILVIPCISATIRKETIIDAFKKIHICELSKIELIENKSVTHINKKGKYNIAFIHIHKWLNTDTAQFALNRLKEQKEIKLVYDIPWFWKITAFKSKESKEPKNKRTKEHI